MDTTPTEKMQESAQETTQVVVTEVHDEVNNKKRKALLTPARARALNIFNSSPILPQETKDRIYMVRKILGNAALALNDLFQGEEVKYDVGVFMASLDALQLAKDTAINSLTLPHCESDERE